MKKHLSALALMSCLSMAPANASTLIFKCAFPNLNEIFFTLYDDGSQPRIGVSQGVGNKGYSFYDQQTRSWGIVELNGGQMPVSLTSINAKGVAVHSRQLNTLPDGDFLAPSQGQGTCTKQEIK